MSIRKIFFIIAIIFCSSCSSDVFLVHNGSIPSNDKIALIHNGQSKQHVTNILGSPSLKTGLNDNHWIYMASTTKKVAFLKPEEIDRKILAITFDNDKITKIEKLSLQDGNNISIDKDETKATDRELGFFKKYFGGVGAYMPFGGNSEQGL